MSTERLNKKTAIEAEGVESSVEGMDSIREMFEQIVVASDQRNRANLEQVLNAVLRPTRAIREDDKQKDDKQKALNQHNALFELMVASPRKDEKEKDVSKLFIELNLTVPRNKKLDTDKEHADKKQDTA